MDNFHEEVVVRKRGQALSTLMYWVSWVVAVICALIAASQLMALMNNLSAFSWQGLLVMLLAAGVGFVFYRNKDNLRTEYEYTFTSGEMDFARVMGNVRRKHMFTVALKNVEAGGLAEGQKYLRYQSMKDVKLQDLTLNRDARQVFLFLVKDGQKQLILLEPSDKMMDLMRQSNPRAISFTA